MEKNKEIWKDIYFIDKEITYDYRGLYQVSNYGRVKSLSKTVRIKNNHTKISKEKILKPGSTSNGYLIVNLYKNEKGKSFRVNRLVAIMFIPNPENKPEVNHKFGIKVDNRENQLEWTTTSENLKHAYNMGLKKVNDKQKEIVRKMGKRNAKRIIQFDLHGNYIKKWDSQLEAERNLNINHVNISRCCKGKQKQAGGYVWKYE